MTACILDDKSFEICMLDNFMWGLMEPSAAQNLGRRAGRPILQLHAIISSDTLSSFN